jgi:hypothetical protein
MKDEAITFAIKVIHQLIERGLTEGMYHDVMSNPHHPVNQALYLLTKSQSK